MSFSFISGLLSGVLAGVLVAVFSQFLLKGIVEPAQQLKGKIAELDIQLDLLVTQRIGKHYRITENEIGLINKLSVEIHSLPYQILMYSITRCLFGLPSCSGMKEVYCKFSDLFGTLRFTESIIKEMKPFSFPEESFQKDNARRSQIEQIDRNTNYVKTLAQEIKKLLNIRQRNPKKRSKPPGNPPSHHRDQRKTHR